MKVSDRILELHDRSLDNRFLKEKLEYRDISSREAMLIEKQTGIKAEGYVHAVESEFFRHCYKRHGDEKKEAARGQAAITRSDFEKLPEIIAAPDKRTRSKNKAGLDCIVYAKRVNGIIFFVEEVRTGKKVLMAVTMYKKIAGTPDAAVKQSPRPNGRTDTGNKKSITENCSDVKSLLFLLTGVILALYAKESL